MADVFEAKTVKAPRIEVALIPHGSTQIGPFSMWLILHTPGQEPHTVALGRKHLSREQAIQAMLAVYTKIGEEFAFGDAAQPGGTA